MGLSTILHDWYIDNHEHLEGLPFAIWVAFMGLGFFTLGALIYLAIFIAAPIPRGAYKEEKTYRTILPDGTTSERTKLPCWHDRWRAVRQATLLKHEEIPEGEQIEPAEVFISVVVPAYNEEERLAGMLEETVDFLQKNYKLQATPKSKKPSSANKTTSDKKDTKSITQAEPQGWEILVVSDGSTDKTEDVALTFAKNHQLANHPHDFKGPWKEDTHGTSIPYGSIRVIRLEENRGKGGAVTHGLRHVRGQYTVFADADGASRFEDVAALLRECKAVEDDQGRGVAIGSRAHLVGSDAVVKRSALRNFLMHSFHLFIRLLTTPRTSLVRDTQCGFKLFSRTTLPYIIPYMHSEGWIFDVEMLMLAESAGIEMVEVPIGWKEVAGSKLDVVRDSVGMAWGLVVLRVSWAIGVYSRA